MGCEAGRAREVQGFDAYQAGAKGADAEAEEAVEG